MTKKAIILFFPLLRPEGNSSNYPWALIYLERMVRDLDIEIILVDERINNDYTEIILHTKGRLLFAGVSAILGFQVAGGVKFSTAVKNLTGAPVIWGGWFASVFPEMLLKGGHADYVCLGQGELPFRSFTEKMISGGDISGIPGIGLGKNDRLMIEPNSELTDPAGFPRIKISLFDVNKLIDINGKVEPGHRGADYIASTGCPNNCAFCNLELVFGRKWFPKSIPEIMEDLSFLKENASVSHITFSDDNFFAGKKFVMDFCESLERSGLSLTWEANAHLGFFLKKYKDEDIRKLYRSGCRRIKIGAESGSQEVLDLINKKIKVEDTFNVVRLLKKHHIRIRLFTMVCFPPDPDKDFWKTLNLIGRAKLIDRSLEANIDFYGPIPGTVLYKYCTDHGFAYPETVEELIRVFSQKFTAPWYKRDYHKQLGYFLNFYFRFADPLFFLNFSILLRPLILLLSLFLYPAIYLRFKSNFMKFPFEAMLFNKIIRFQSRNNFPDSIFSYKMRV